MGKKFLSCNFEPDQLKAKTTEQNQTKPLWSCKHENIHENK